MTGNQGSRRQAELAQRVLDFIGKHRLEPGDPLREQRLAAYLGVSRTPTRGALRLLESYGVVKSLPNQGYVLEQPHSEIHSVALILPPSADEALYLSIVEDHVSGNLTKTINQIELLRRYSASAPAMRRVLTRMANEGLVERNPGHGWTFRTGLDTEEARIASYEYRRALEPQAMLLPGFSIDVSTLDALESQHQQLLKPSNTSNMPGPTLFRIDANFHETLVRCSGNALFLQAIQSQNQQRRMLEYLGYTNRRRVSDWCQEHLAVIDALRHGDRNLAAQHLAHHLDQARHTSTHLTD